MATQVAYLLALALALQPLGRISPPRLALGTALALMIAGGWLRRLCIRTLGEDFTGDVRVRRGQRVVERGPYRWVRHPSYSAAIVLLTGCGLAMANWGSALVMLLAASRVYGRRAQVEERVLEAALGEPYREFARTRPRFLPRLRPLSRSGR